MFGMYRHLLVAAVWSVTGLLKSFATEVVAAPEHCLLPVIWVQEELQGPISLSSKTHHWIHNPGKLMKVVYIYTIYIHTYMYIYIYSYIHILYICILHVPDSPWVKKCQDPRLAEQFWLQPALSFKSSSLLLGGSVAGRKDNSWASETFTCNCHRSPGPELWHWWHLESWDLIEDWLNKNHVQLAGGETHMNKNTSNTLWSGFEH